MGARQFRNPDPVALVSLSLCFVLGVVCTARPAGGQVGGDRSTQTRIAVSAPVPGSSTISNAKVAPPAIPQSAVSILDEVLRASGVEDPGRREHYARMFASTLDELRHHVGTTRVTYRKARRLHDALHKYAFKRYVSAADGIDAILDRGEYNCVSATLFYGIAARAMGLEMQVVETPRHIFLQYEDEDRAIDIETTSPMGFDFRGDLERFRRITAAYAFSMAQDITRSPPYARFDRYEAPLQAPVTLERATAFLWHNTAERALARGSAERAARDLSEEHRAYPELAERLDEFAMSMARAFRIEYEAGRFDSAFEIAAIEVRIFPRKTSSRDRLLAAASKQIEAACEAGDPTGAEAMLDRARDVIAVTSDTVKLERETCPHIAAASVRISDWNRANRMASRYAAVELDHVEATRFLEWVMARETNSKNGEEACWEPRWSPRRAELTDDSAGARPHAYEDGPEPGSEAGNQPPTKRRHR